MEKKTGLLPRWQLYALIPALAFGLALVGAAALAMVSARSGVGFKQACMAVPRGEPWQEASEGLVKSGGKVTGWGGPTDGPVLQRDWGREAFPLRKQRCNLVLDENGLVMESEYEWWFKYGPGAYHTARIKQALGLQAP
jgi:hypothetical protein